MYKDEVLAVLSETCNVAYFFSINEKGNLRFSNIADFYFETLELALIKLMSLSPTHAVGIRSFKPGNTKSCPLHLNVNDCADAITKIKALMQEGYYIIVNEYYDLIADQVVSGVVLGDIIEFAPLTTPRCVETAGVTTLEREVGIRFLNTCLGGVSFNFDHTKRVEFTIHQFKRGNKNQHIVIWECEESNPVNLLPVPDWPNNMSKYLGDKAYGLLLAHSLGFMVPWTLAIGRNFKPFQFGNNTSSNELWMRTCPHTPISGYFPTLKGCSDPFKLMSEIESEAISSLLYQQHVDATYSGAAVSVMNNFPIIEGVRGNGAEFMLGNAKGETLPDATIAAVMRVHKRLEQIFGPVKVEWAEANGCIWILQINKTLSEFLIKVAQGEGILENIDYVDFDTTLGLNEFHKFIQTQLKTNSGIRLIGDVGITSHFGDIVRQYQIPTLILRS